MTKKGDEDFENSTKCRVGDNGQSKTWLSYNWKI